MASKSRPSGLRITAWVLLGVCIVYFGLAMFGNTSFAVFFYIQLGVGLLLLFIDFINARYPEKSTPSPTPGPKPEQLKPKPAPVLEPIPPPRPRGLLNGRYEIVNRQWKRGGMAVVQLAKDYETKSQCVIKIPRVDTEHSVKFNIEKLKIEADYLQKSDHPNIVKLMDQFTEKDVFHLVEEYVEGDNLLKAFESKQAEEHKVRKWAVQILDALDYVHRSGMVHRDLNPKNIMLTRDDNMVLIDFGTVKVVEDSSSTIYTTVGFSAPEVTKGFTDEKSDIYGVGSILLYMLTSLRIGFIGNKNTFDLLLSKGISQRIAKCIDQALQMDPAFRFQTAAVMRTAILGG